MIKSFLHKGIQAFFETGSKAGIRPDHTKRLKRQLLALDAASSPVEMDVPGWKLHSLSHNLNGHWAVTVSANWRLTFAFEEGDATLVDYHDYH
jgi:proteic killer suppression protein